MKFYALLLTLLITSPALAMEYALMESYPRSSVTFEFSVQALEKIVKENDLDKATQWVTQRKADINAVTCRCRRPYSEHLIGLAAGKGHLPLVRALLDKKVSANSKNGDPVKQAVASGHTQMVELLLSNGAQVEGAQKALLMVQRSLPPTKAAAIQQIINTYRFDKCTL